MKRKEKQKVVTISIKESTVAAIDQMKVQTGFTRSHIIDTYLRESLKLKSK